VTDIPSRRNARGTPGERQETGRLGEQMAARYLQSLGYAIVETNYRTRFGEIDIVALDGDVLVFVEVRARHGRSFGLAEESLTPRKRERLVQLSECYLQAHPTSPPACRIDVVAIALGSAGNADDLQLIKGAIVQGLA